ncbi:tight junction protein ZO-1-like isoform X2 [Panonychus citri]|uniref:tight junction protein ZO-1-like isoform X2 n=1 Tax=Panonychus citri TaxID=50023 RepID=UPI002307F97C|nr:tight junction protein ZO-1-like isoform X2 [Panonychus citri]
MLKLFQSKSPNECKSVNQQVAKTQSDKLLQESSIAKWIVNNQPQPQQQQSNIFDGGSSSSIFDEFRRRRKETTTTGDKMKGGGIGGGGGYASPFATINSPLETIYSDLTSINGQGNPVIKQQSLQGVSSPSSSLPIVYHHHHQQPSQFTTISPIRNRNQLIDNSYQEPKKQSTDPPLMEKKKKQPTIKSNSKSTSNKKKSKNIQNAKSTHQIKMKSKRINPKGSEKIGWEYKDVTLTRIPRFGFGIAVSGGRDNPHFPSDPSIAISDVLKNGPAEGKLLPSDRVMSVNGVSLECVDYNTAVQVLRECGNTVNLLIKRRVVLPGHDLLKVTLTRSNKKDDFGIVLGCQLYIKEISNRSLIDKECNIAEGDVVLKINNTSTDNLSLKEARKLIHSSKDKLNLVLKREQNNNNNNNNISNNSINNSNHVNEFNARFNGSMSNGYKENGVTNDIANQRSAWSNQNVYVQPPTRGTFGRLMTSTNDDHRSNSMNRMQQQQQQANSNASGRHRGPITDLSQLTSLDPNIPAVNSILNNSHTGGGSEINGEGVLSPSGRPPIPRPGKGGVFGEDEMLSMRRTSMNVSSEPRLISFKKEGSVGIRLTGGNQVGIFVCAIQPGSPASLQGLQTGDKLLKVNSKEMRGLTKEEAVIYLLSVQDQVDLIVQFCKDEYEEILANQKGDSFYVRTHYKYDGSSKGELDFQMGEIFHVVDTLHNGVVGSWLVYRVNGKTDVQKGVIPNESRAEELSALNSENNKKDTSMGSSSRVGFFRRRSARRSKSLGKDHWEDVILSDGGSKFSAYEKVSLKHPGFIRPVVMFGALADIARDKLLKDYPDKYASPHTEDSDQDPDCPGKSQKSLGIIRLSAIREIIEKGKHALLDVTPTAVDRLNYAQFAPIVIFLRAENKTIVKELRSRHVKPSQKSSRKLFESSTKLEKMYSHLFTSVINLGTAEMWYKKLRETIEKQQQINIWISDSKPPETITDDFLLPMTSRLSYASSPESDLDLANESKRGDKEDNCGSSRLVKASSDPSIATVEEPSTFGPPPYNSRSHRSDLSQTMSPAAYSKKKEALERDEYFASMKDPYNALYPNERYPSSNGNTNGPTVTVADIQPIYMRTSVSQPPSATNGPEPPPRIDRANKPNRFRSAHEALFGISDRDADNPPDYINTAITPTGTLQASTNGGGTKNSSLDRHSALVNGRTSLMMDNSSHSSDSYKYISPTSTFDDRRYGSIASANSTLNMNPRQNHDTYMYSRGGNPKHPINGSPSKSMDPDSIKVMSNLIGSNYSGDNYRQIPPSPPPKPSNYQTLRMNDGRPVPPPKPMHYQQVRSGWRPETTDKDQLNNNSFQLVKRSNSSAIDMSAGPPAYFPPTQDQPPNTRAPEVPTASYVNHSSLSSPTRRAPCSDTDSSNGYMAGKNNYDPRSPYSSSKLSSHSSSMLNGNSAYLNIPFPPRNRDSIACSGNGQQSNNVIISAPGLTSTTPQLQQQQHVQTPPSLIDLSSNRENRGSAFELYRKPGDSLNRAGYPLHGLPPPPPLISDHEVNASPSISVDSNQNVIAMAKGTFGSAGGTLHCEDTGVTIIIPEGAIPVGVEQEIYFKVCYDSDMLPPLDRDKETLTSPIVMCGPHGIKFNLPVELRLPHSPTVNPATSSFSLKLSDTPNGKPTEWQNVALGTNEWMSASNRDENYLSILLDHF